MSESKAPRLPTFEERRVMWRTLDFKSSAASYPHVEDYVTKLRERFANGRVLFHTFAIPAHPIFEWYLQHNQLHECNFFEMFWRTLTPATVLPYQLADLNYYEQSVFEWTGAFHLGGDLSAMLFSGGAYSRSTGYGLEARRFGEAAADELLASDYETTLCYRCDFAWSTFFMDVAWDRTLMVISKPRRLIHVLLATDTD